MRTVGTRELKQNPNAVIQHVLTSSEEVEITSHGRPTGVRLVPDRPARTRWVHASSLTGLRPLDEQNRADLHALLDADQGDDTLIDPWERRA